MLGSLFRVIAFMDGLFKRTHLEHGDLLGREESVFAAGNILLGETGELDAVKLHHLIAHFLEDTAHHAVLSGVNL